MRGSRHRIYICILPWQISSNYAEHGFCNSGEAGIAYVNLSYGVIALQVRQEHHQHLQLPALLQEELAQLYVAPLL